MKRKFWAATITLLITLAMAGLAAAADECAAVYGDGPNQVRLATGSPGELGLVEVLVQAFAPDHDASVCWVKAGSGVSLKLLQEKKVDVIMVHAPAAEKKAVAEGWAIKRSLLGSNEFYIVGPTDDPAGIAEAKTAADAYARIAQTQSKFISRGDNSGTHKKELAVWEQTGVKPSGDWYIVTKDFMMASLMKANEIQAYFMTDSSTWVQGKKDLGGLKILFRGDPFLINTYHALCQPDGATEAAGLAAQFIDFLVSEEGQKIVADYGKTEYGEGLYNDQEYAKQFDH